VNDQLSRGCWFLGGVSLFVSLWAVRKMRNENRINSLADAAWLKDSNVPDELSILASQMINSDFDFDTIASIAG